MSVTVATPGKDPKSKDLTQSEIGDLEFTDFEATGLKNLDKNQSSFKTMNQSRKAITHITSGLSLKKPVAKIGPGKKPSPNKQSSIGKKKEIDKVKATIPVNFGPKKVTE